MSTHKDQTEIIEKEETSKNSHAEHVHGPNCNHGHHHAVLKPITRETPKLGRNDICSCGSNKKFKKCCGM
jgi:uncharacterized protein YecA (UPF0149 family)